MVPVLHNRARMTLPEDHRNRRNDQGQDEGKKQRAGYPVIIPDPDTLEIFGVVAHFVHTPRRRN